MMTNVSIPFYANEKSLEKPMITYRLTVASHPGQISFICPSPALSYASAAPCGAYSRT